MQVFRNNIPSCAKGGHGASALSIVKLPLSPSPQHRRGQLPGSRARGGEGTGGFLRAGSRQVSPEQKPASPWRGKNESRLPCKWLGLEVIWASLLVGSCMAEFPFQCEWARACFQGQQGSIWGGLGFPGMRVSAWESSFQRGLSRRGTPVPSKGTRWPGQSTGVSLGVQVGVDGRAWEVAWLPPGWHTPRCRPQLPQSPPLWRPTPLPFCNRSAAIGTASARGCGA